MQLLNNLSEILHKFDSLLFLKKKEFKRLLLTVTQFQISDTSIGGVSWEIWNFQNSVIAESLLLELAVTYSDIFLLKLFYFREHNIYKGLFSFIYKDIQKCLNF